jgi:hypothetical protein
MVPVDTVQFVKITPKYSLRVSRLHLDKTYIAKHSPQLPDVLTYSSEKTGIVYETQRGEVTTIYYNDSNATCTSIEGRELSTRR